MGEPKWTPGPLEVKNLTDVFTTAGGRCRDGRKADANDGWHTASCLDGVTFVNGEEAELSLEEKQANAQLYAAAPELAEWLDPALDLLGAYLRGDTDYFLDIDVEGILEAGEAALAKARGEARP